MAETNNESFRLLASSKQTANEFLDQLRSDVPGAARVEKMEVPQSKHCLVHIRQVHLPLHDEKIPRKEIETDGKYDDMRRVQTDIYLILHHLIQYCDVNEIFVEGLTEVGEEEIKAYPLSRIRTNREITGNVRKANELRDRLEDIEQKLLDHATPLTDDTKEDLQFRADLCRVQIRGLERQNRQEKEFSKNMEIIIDDALLCAGDFLKRNKVRIRAAENSVINERAVRDVREKGNAHMDFNLVLEERENYLLKKCSENEKPVCVTIFGGSHDWSDNIAQWNKEHPDDKFSLVIITPKSYKE